MEAAMSLIDISQFHMMEVLYAGGSLRSLDSLVLDPHWHCDPAWDFDLDLDSWDFMDRAVLCQDSLMDAASIYSWLCSQPSACPTNFDLID